MALVDADFEKELEEIVEGYFRLDFNGNGTVSLIGTPHDQNIFHIYLKHSSNSTVLEIVRVLLEAYSDFVEFYKDETTAKFFQEAFKTLNKPSEISAQFVETVLMLEAPAIHKILLLTSGNSFLSSENIDSLETLARAKEYSFEYPTGSNNLEYYCGGVENIYILPGVLSTLSNLHSSRLSSIVQNASLKDAAVIMAFISQNSDVVTLREALDQRFEDMIHTRNSVLGIGFAINALEVYYSGYRDLALSFNSRALAHLGRLLDSGAASYDFPKEFLKNRALAMADSSENLHIFSANSISLYLSKDEGVRLKRSINELRLGSLMGPFKPNHRGYGVIHAALIEVLAVKGPQCFIEVAEEMSRVSLSPALSPEKSEYQAMVGLILLALHDSDDTPFSWKVQMSPHSWLFSDNRGEDWDFLQGLLKREDL